MFCSVVQACLTDNNCDTLSTSAIIPVACRGAERVSNNSNTGGPAGNGGINGPGTGDGGTGDTGSDGDGTGGGGPSRSGMDDTKSGALIMLSTIQKGLLPYQT